MISVSTPNRLIKDFLQTQTALSMKGLCRGHSFCYDRIGKEGNPEEQGPVLWPQRDQ